MSKATPLFALLMLLILVGGGCGKPDASPQTTVIMPSGEEQKTVPAPGQIAYDYPVQSVTTAKTGEYVLAIPRVWVEQSFENPSTAVFIYYAAKMVNPGTNESEIETLSGEKMTAPNSLIIPLKDGAKAKKGDVVLTWWQTGSGMSRAIVVGGSETEPEVLYFDREYSPEDKAEKLMPNSFVKLSSGDQAGATIACKTPEEQDFTRYQLVNSTSDKVLLLGWAGKMVTMKKADCATLPTTPTAKVGESVYFPLYGKFDLGTVTKVDEAIGHVTVKYTFAGQNEEAMVPFGDIATQFVR